MSVVEVVDGDLLDEPADAVVNAWNRNPLPWWIVRPTGVSGAIKRKAGLEPFRELRAMGMIPLGGAVITTAGRLPYKAIIHVAGINLLWRASVESVGSAARSAVDVAAAHGYQSVAMPVIGSGSGGFDEAKAIGILTKVISDADAPVRVRIVRFRRGQ